jgi:hypothetical protein
MPILNAQLQTALALARYAATTGDDEAAAFADDMRTAARTLLPQFDQGCWSLYSLDGGPASPSYHRYHITLLEQLSGTTGEPVWRDMARSWKRSC